MAAWLVVALKVTPQFVQSPPEKPAKPLPPLVSVLVSVGPLIRYTSVLLATQTVCPVPEFDEHELTGFAVGMRVGVIPVPSIWTSATPVTEFSQLPFGT